MKKSLVLVQFVLSSLLFSTQSRAAYIGIIIFDETYYQGSVNEQCSASWVTCAPTVQLKQTGDKASCISPGNRNLRVTSSQDPGVQSMVYEYINRCGYGVVAKIKSGNFWSEPVTIPGGGHNWINVSYGSYSDKPVEIMFGNPNSDPGQNPNPQPSPSPNPGALNPKPISSGNVGQCQPGVGNSNIPGHSVVNLERQSLTEIIPVPGAPFDLVYSSDRYRKGSNFNVKAALVGSWSLSILHYYDIANDVLYYGDGSIDAGNKVWKFSDKVVVAKKETSEMYYFDLNGFPTSIMEGVSGKIRWSFKYTNGKVTSLTDRYGQAYQVSDQSIITPNGQRTDFAYNSLGQLSKVTNRSGEKFELSYDGNARLVVFQKPSGVKTSITYDENGNLLKDEGAGGSYIALDSKYNAQDGLLNVSVSTASGKTRRVQILANNMGSSIIHFNEFGGRSSINTNAKSLASADASYSDIYSGLYSSKVEAQSDFAGVPYTRSSKFTVVNSNINVEKSFSKKYVFPNGNGELYLQSTVTLQNNPKQIYIDIFDQKKLQTTSKSPLGRVVVVKKNEALDPISIKIGDYDPISLSYGTAGSLTSISQGDRQQDFAYDNFGNLMSSIDALGKKSIFEYDKSNRLVKQIFPDGKFIGFSYDVDGKIQSITPPEKPAHSFGYNVLGVIGKYLPPAVQSKVTGETVYSYDLDKNLVGVSRPDGAQIQFDYEKNSTRVLKISAPNGVYGIQYNDRPGIPSDLVKSIIAPDGTNLSFEYIWKLPSLMATSGEVSSAVQYSYNSDMSVASISVAGGDRKFLSNKISYDLDSLIVGVGSLAMIRNSSGAAISTTLGKVVEGIGFNTFGEPISSGFTIDKNPIFGMSYNRDKVGRITASQDVTATTKVISTYEYDAQGRLSKVTKGSDTRSYTYDANGNRLSFTGGAKSYTGVYDDQDRLLSYGNSKFEYNDNGDLQTRTDLNPDTKEVKTTSYTYDVFGNLRKVVLPDGRLIEYVIDGQNRRIGKKINGKVVQAFIYQSQYQIAAEMDGSGKIVKSFVYASKINIPDYVNYNGKQYRIISDQVGTPKMIVDAATGAVAESFNYDEFGVSQDGKVSNIIPFGFAGGLYDSDTGLVRFGARDYSPIVGRWTNKDPIGFGGGQGNLYQYTFGDPINYLDPSGNFGMIGAGIGFISGAIGGYSTGGFWGGVAGSVAGGLIGGIIPAASGTAGAAVGGFASNIIGQVLGNGISGASLGSIDVGQAIVATFFAGVGSKITTVLQLTGLISQTTVAVSLDAIGNTVGVPLNTGPIDFCRVATGKTCTLDQVCGGR